MFSIKPSKKNKLSGTNFVGTGYDAIDKPLAGVLGELPFQEDLMRLFASVTGVDFGEADNLRRIVGKKYDMSDPKQAKVILTARQQWLDGCVTNGIDNETAHHYWDKIIANSAYSFNLSHSVAYSVITYQTLWYYKNYPRNFITARLNTNPDEFMLWVGDCARLNIKFAKPSIQDSSDKYVADKTRDIIYMPLTSISGLGEKAQNEIISKRPFADIKDFRSRVSKRAVSSPMATKLWIIGAFDNITGTYDDLETGIGITQFSTHGYLLLDKKGKEVGKYDNIDIDLGVWVMSPRLLAEVNKLNSVGYEHGFVTKIGDGFTQKGASKKEIYINDSKFPSFFIGGWERDKFVSIGNYVAYKRKSGYGGRYVEDIHHLTHLI